MVLKDDSAVVCSFLNIFLVTVGSESPLLNTAGGIVSYYFKSTVESTSASAVYWMSDYLSRSLRVAGDLATVAIADGPWSRQAGGPASA